jgi:hypothetical protein
VGQTAASQLIFRESSVMRKGAQNIPVGTFFLANFAGLFRELCG